jgi:probable phosphoglycerate mutase
MPARKGSMTRLIIVRHGRTAWNREERFRGRTEVPLDEVGEAQVEACARIVATRFRPSAIYASPLQRTLRTADAIGRRCGLTPLPHQGLVDMSFGEAEGLTWPEADARWLGLGSAWRNAPHTATFPGGETLAVVRGRLMAAVKAIAAGHADEEIVLVGHNATNRVLLLAALGLPDERFWRIGQDTAAVNVLDLEDDIFTVVTLNDTCHLNPTIMGEEKAK